MSRIISRSEIWEKAYEVFQNVNFSAFDFNTIKQSMVEYIKLYFPEDFNDFIESSEFVAILELFAYAAELLAYRADLNAHENLLPVAQRKESILRLAKLISYNPSRNIPARGLVKVTSVKTTEDVFDSSGRNLANTKINWNDPNNPDWKDQFVLILNRVLEQPYGTVTPDERVQVDDVLFELYALDNAPLRNGVIPFSAAVSGRSVPMEAVPVALDSLGPLERRPENQSKFSFLYGNDGLGDGSDTTGFFFFVKQGQLTKVTANFDGITPNQTYTLTANNINDTDLWINNIDPETGAITDDGNSEIVRSGEWQEVDIANAQNIVFNTNPNRKKYEVETLENDRVRLIFGDGEFADIPAGTFEFWYRTSLNEDIVIPRNAVVNKNATFTYVDIRNNTQTLTFTFSLINSLQNASPSEDIEHIRRIAPAVYYTQDRMVNGRDYNTFMLRDPTILKLRSVVRTYAGDSKYVEWHDPSETYENVRLTGDDLAIYYNRQNLSQSVSGTTDTSEIVNNHIEPYLSSSEFFVILASRGVSPTAIRREFTSSEDVEINNALATALSAVPDTVNLFYSITNDQWVTDVTNYTSPDASTFANTAIVTIQVGPIVGQWTITVVSERLVANSSSIKFWNTNSGNRTITNDTLNSTQDLIVVLKANENDKRLSLLSANWNFTVLSQQVDDSGLQSIHELNILPQDENNDGFADNLDLDEIIDPLFDVTIAQQLNFDFNYIYDANDGNVDIIVTDENGNTLTVGVDWNPTFTNNSGTSTVTSNNVANGVNIISFGSGTSAKVYITDYVYFNRETVDDGWVVKTATPEVIQKYINDQLAANGLWKRAHGRSDLNFTWLHRTPRFGLIDPSAVNLIDTFIVSRGYYTATRRWLEEQTTIEPDKPTPLQLRTDYGKLIDNKMISDTVILTPGKIKPLFGPRAIPQLQATFKVIRSSTSNMTNNQIKVSMVDVIREFFDIKKWEFGETFYFTELNTAIHNALGPNIKSVVLVPTKLENQFGDLFEVFAREDEILQPNITVNGIEIVESYTSQTLRQDPS